MLLRAERFGLFAGELGGRGGGRSLPLPREEPCRRILVSFHHPESHPRQLCLLQVDLLLSARILRESDSIFNTGGRKWREESSRRDVRVTGVDFKTVRQEELSCGLNSKNNKKKHHKIEFKSIHVVANLQKPYRSEDKVMNMSRRRSWRAN